MRDVPSRLDISIERMQEYYPEFSPRVLPNETGWVAVWKGTVEPIRTKEGLREVLDDIAHERPVAIHANGAVLHYNSCPAVHDHHWWMDKLPDSWPAYKLEVQYDGTSAHPRAFVHSPYIPRYRRWKHHFGDGAICAYPTWEHVWRWDEHTVVDFMGHAATWLIKWTLWDRLKIWVGREMSHDSRFLSSVIKPHDECWCGWGQRYADCHMSQDKIGMPR